MTEWATVPIFGRPPVGASAIIRPSVYGVVVDEAGSVAIIRTPQGWYLPGGGIEPGETPRDAVMREAREECGLDLELGAWSVLAVDFVYSPTERSHFEKRSTFVDARQCGSHLPGREADHELQWMTPQQAITLLSHPSHQWAVERWHDRCTP
jgi:8-oxo-dGTP diphosphatase